MPPPFMEIILMLLAVDFSSSLMLLMKMLVRSGSDMKAVPLLSTYRMAMIPKPGDMGISSRKNADSVTPMVMLLRPPMRRDIPAARPF